MLCIICHRKHHFRGLAIPKDIPKFSEEIVKHRLSELLDDCPVCKGHKSILSKTCSIKCSYDLSGKSNKKFDWDRIDLYKEIQEQGSVPKAAKKLGLSPAAVYKRANKIGLDYKKVVDLGNQS